MTVEAANVGNVDDVVVAKVVEPSEYIQVKAAVTAKEPATIDWLMTPTRSRGTSILQRFHRAFQDLRHDGRSPQLTLITNRSIDPEDPILILRDRNDRLAHRQHHSTQAATVAARREVTDHLGCTDDKLYEFLNHLRLHTDASEAAWRDYHIRDISYAAGVRADEAAFRLGLSEVREWVKTNRTEKRASDSAEAVRRLDIRAQDPFTVLTIKALDEEPELPDAGVELDWVDRFRGTEAHNRRGLKDLREWETVLRPQLLQAQRVLRGRGARRILITGTMRLPTWFTAGVMFQETAGFTPAKIKDGQLWVKPTHIVKPASIVLSNPISDLPPCAEMALALAISADPTEDVKRHIASTGQDLPIVTVYLPGGISNASVIDCDHAYGIALAVRNLAREIARTASPPVIHLFMAAPPDWPFYSAASGTGYLQLRHTRTSTASDTSPHFSYQTDQRVVEPRSTDHLHLPPGYGRRAPTVRSWVG